MKLYPPNIEGTIPAFSGDILIVPFMMNKTVSKRNVRGFSLKIKTVQSNILVKVATASKFDLETMEAQFTVKGLKVGQYYKAQMAYIGEDGVVGYYSTVGVVKCTSTPLVYIENLEPKKTNVSLNSYLGIYNQEEQDVSEKVYSHSFVIRDSNGKIFAESGEKLHNSFQDTEAFESSDEFFVGREMEINRVYYIQYNVTTVNKMKVSSPIYRVTRRSSIKPELSAALISSLNAENGYINLTLDGKKDDYGIELAATGTFLISRASSKDNYGSWEDVLKFALNGQQPSKWNWNDFTIEHGHTYKYALQQYNGYQLYSNKIISNSTYAVFEDSFLFDGKRQLKIKFNPKVSSFKTVTQEAKIDTIGSQYPFMFKNGNVSYKEFPISGLISYYTDEEQLFMSEEDIRLLEPTTNLTNENIASERLFKLQVLNFLSDGKPKVFRSPNEGNYIVRLLNTSLAPTDSLGRMLHTFTSNAYEIAAFSSKELSKYGFINVFDPPTIQMKWETVPFVKTDGSGNVIYVESNKKLNRREARTVLFQDMAPGDLVSIDHKIIAIGTTGSYYMDIGTPVEDIRIVSDGKHQGQLIYGYLSNSQNKFDTITGIAIADLPMEQYLGEKDILPGLEDTKHLLDGFYFIRFSRRELVEAYTDNENLHIWIGPNKKELLTLFDPLDMYYIKNIDKEPGFADYILDGQTKEHIPLEKYSNFIYINDSPMDLTETVTYEIKLPSNINSIRTGNGIISECSIQRKEVFYLVEDEKAVQEAKLAYDLAKEQLLSVQCGRMLPGSENRAGVNIKEDYPDGGVVDYLNTLEVALSAMEIAYDDYIASIDAAIKAQEEEGR